MAHAHGDLAMHELAHLGELGELGELGAHSLLAAVDDEADIGAADGDRHVDAPDIMPLSEMMRKLPLPFIVDHMVDNGKSPIRSARMHTGSCNLP